MVNEIGIENLEIYITPTVKSLPSGNLRSAKFAARGIRWAPRGTVF